MSNPKDPSGGHDCPEGGIGCKRESLPTGSAFITMTGGSLMQRRFEREYGKAAHNAPPDPFPDTSDAAARRIVFGA